MTTPTDPTHLDAVANAGCTRVRLNTPDGRNALGQDLAGQLLQALQRAEDTPGCRALVLSSRTAYFCAGLELPTDGRPPPWLDTTRPGPLDVFARIARSPLVTIAVVEGPAIGGGVGLAASCDLVIAGSGASFRLTETMIGLTPKVITPYLVRRTGGQRAFALALTGTETGPQEAHRIGLVDYLAPSPDTCVREVLAAVRRTDAQAVRALKADYNNRQPPTPQAHEQAAGELRQAFTHLQVHTRIAELRAVGVLP